MKKTLFNKDNRDVKCHRQALIISMMIRFIVVLVAGLDIGVPSSCWTDAAE